MLSYSLPTQPVVDNKARYVRLLLRLLGVISWLVVVLFCLLSAFQ